MIDEDVFDGVWVTFTYQDTDIFDMWMPRDRVELEITDEEYEEGYLWKYTNPDGTAFVMIQECTADQFEDIESYEDLIDLLEDNGYYNNQIFETNGITCLLQDAGEENFACVWILRNDGGAYKFLFYPSRDESFSATFYNMICSISQPGE